MTIDFELHQQAYELAVLDGLTLDNVARRTGIPRSTITRWSADEDWMADRAEYRRAQGEIRRKTVLYRKGLLDAAMQSLDPQAAYAWATVENAARKAESGAAPQTEPAGEREIKTAEDAVAALQEAVEIRINRMLTNPGELKLSAIRDMQKALEMVEQMKRRFGEESGEEAEKQQGNDAEQARYWREKVLGVR